MRYLRDKFRIIIPPDDIACAPGCIQRLANGDREAYAWIYKNYCERVYQYALLITKNETLSEDIVQSVFLRLWTKREKLQSVLDFNGYFYMLYRNYIFDVLEKEQREQSGQKEFVTTISVPARITEETVAYNETRRLMNDVVKQLPPQQRLIFKLSREYGWKTCYIAKELKLSECTVKSHLQKADRKLREEFMAHGA